MTNKLKQRFCKDKGLSIQVFEEPYFTQRIELLGALDDYRVFCDLIENTYNNGEVAFLAEYDSIRDEVIEYIKKSPAFESLNSADMNQYKCKVQVKQSDIYKANNVGETFVSIDLKKANFSALVLYAKINKLDFWDNYDWFQFMRKFTNEDYFICSKYLRQVIFGNCNPKRFTTYEKWIVDSILVQLIEQGIVTEDQIVSCNSDELILKGSVLQRECLNTFLASIETFGVPLRVSKFKLYSVLGTGAYIKEFTDDLGNIEYYETKCAKPQEVIYIHRLLNNMEIIEDDNIFISEGRLAKYLDTPGIQLNFEKSV